MPARLIHQDEGMRAWGHGLRDLVQVQGHARGGAAGQDKPRSFALSRADRAEDVGRGGPLVFRG